MTQQTTPNLLMIRPYAFGFNAQTAVSNAFQHNDGSLSPTEIANLARDEFDDMVALIRSKDITVNVFEDLKEPYTPDSVFPNNWISFHEDGRVVLYPMAVPFRRKERRMDIPLALRGTIASDQLIDLTGFEATDEFLESTGSMVLDRVNRVAYACISLRTQQAPLEAFCKKMNYQPVVFTGIDAEGQAIYHTNVMMGLGRELAIICMDAVTKAAEKTQVQTALRASNHHLLEITQAQMNQFAGNMLEVQNRKGDAFIIMSKRAHDSLTLTQIQEISSFAEPIIIPLDVIETYGGGSVRCMIGEIF